jgi:hypothetical protein
LAPAQNCSCLLVWWPSLKEMLPGSKQDDHLASNPCIERDLAAAPSAVFVRFMSLVIGKVEPNSLLVPS